MSMGSASRDKLIIIAFIPQHQFQFSAGMTELDLESMRSEGSRCVPNDHDVGSDIFFQHRSVGC